MTCFIYGLVDPRTLLVRYVGLATNAKRPREHHKPSRLREHSHKNTWIRALIRVGLDYEIVVLEETPSREALVAAERWWIAYGRACGWPLTNLTDGGDGVAGYKPSAEARAKIGAHFRGKKLPADQVARAAAGHRGLKRNAATLAKMSAWTRTPEMKAKISASQRGRTLSPEHRAKLSAAKTGNKNALKARR